VSVTGAPGSPSSVNLADAGKVASHLVKYSHHPDGRAHFSQDGKVRTEIKRQSVPLNEQQGHIFTVLIQGLRAFEPVPITKENKASPRRTTLTFNVTDYYPKAIRIVGRWYWLEDLQVELRPPKIGPIVQAVDTDGNLRSAFIVANPDDTRHVLVLTCTPREALSPNHDVMMFYGGFDPPAVIFNPKRCTRFLAFLYPADDFEVLKRQLGSIDYTPPEYILRPAPNVK
jgi:hypothetical protein